VRSRVVLATRVEHGLQILAGDERDIAIGDKDLGRRVRDGREGRADGVPVPRGTS
jgi:hypothetical protein